MPRRKLPADLDRCPPLGEAACQQSVGYGLADDGACPGPRLLVVALPDRGPLDQLLSPDLQGIRDDLGEERGVHDVRLLVFVEPLMHFTPSFIKGGGEESSKAFLRLPFCAGAEGAGANRR